MERLTHWNEGLGRYTTGTGRGIHSRIAQRLAAYENTNLTPDQIGKIDELYREKCEEVNRLKDELAAECQKHRWIPVEDGLPTPNEKVLVSFREKIRWSKEDERWRKGKCTAIYIPQYTIKSEDLWTDCDESLEEYNEKADTLYVKEGWYEVIEHWDDYTHVAINCEVVAWQPLPELYRPEKGEQQDE